MTETDRDPLFAALAALAVPAPADLFGSVVAEWTVVAGAVEDLFVAFGAHGIRFARTASAVDGAAGFERLFRERFGSPVVPAHRRPAGLLAAARTGRVRSLRFDLAGLSVFEQDVLRATLGIPPGQTRPYRWIAAEAGRPGAVQAVVAVLARNPIPVLIPSHRVVRSDAEIGVHVPGPDMQERLLRAEGTDLEGLRAMARRGVRYLGSDTTNIVCFPTCHHARRITERHQVGFGSTEAAVQAGYRPCRVCRPLADAAA